MFENMYDIHRQPNCTELAKRLTSTIQSIQPKQMIGFHVENANCGLMLVGCEESPGIEIGAFQFDRSVEDAKIDYFQNLVEIKNPNVLKSYVFAEQLIQSKDLQCLLCALHTESENTSATKFPVISKTISNEPELGFYRSGLWTTMKVLLQLGLTNALDSPTNGKRIYKLVMIKFMSKMCASLTTFSITRMTNYTYETAVNMLAKVAWRVDKLATCDGTTVNTQSIIDVSAAVRAEAIKCVSNVRHFLDQFHKKMQSEEDPTKRLQFDVSHDASSLSRYLQD